LSGSGDSRHETDHEIAQAAMEDGWDGSQGSSDMISKAEYPEFHTFAEGVQYLAQGNPIDYEVKIGQHQGALMTREEWLTAVANHSFIDYDGMGNEIDENGNVLGAGPMFDPGWIRPSEASRIRPETKYILWYNR
jgi:hypothetical protein